MICVSHHKPTFVFWTNTIATPHEEMLSMAGNKMTLKSNIIYVVVMHVRHD